MHKSSALTELTVQQGETGDKRTHYVQYGTWWDSAMEKTKAGKEAPELGG